MKHINPRLCRDRTLFCPYGLVRGFKIFALFFFIASCAYAKEVAFEISADSPRVALGEALQLNLSFEGTQSMPQLELSNLEGFQARYLGPSTRMSIVNGQVSSSITHIYTLLPVKTGVFKIGPLKFDYQGNTYISNTIEVEVLPAGQSSPQGYPGRQGQELSQDINDRVFLVIQPQKTRIYLNEVIPLKIKLYVNNLSVRDIEYPKLDQEGFSVGKFGQPKQYREYLGGVNYEVVEFNCRIFALRPGELKIGPASLNCNLLVKKQGRSRGWDDFFEDFFDSYQNYPLNPTSADVAITVLPLPEEGRPADFSGAVGDFEFQLEAGPKELKVGDPVTLKGRISGWGNLSALSIPRMGEGPDFKVYEPRVKQEDDSWSLEQVVMPLSDKVKEVPEITFSFFNPASGRYERLSRGPFPLSVSKPEKQEELKIVESHPASGGLAEEEKLGRDIVYIKTGLGRLKRQGDYLYRNKAFLALQSGPFLGFLLISLYYRRKRRLDSDIRYSRSIRAPKKAQAGLKKARELLAKDDKSGFYDTVFETLQEYLGDKFHLPSKGITVSVIDDILKDKQIDKEIMDRLKEIFQACDMFRYAASESGKEGMSRTLRGLEEVIGYFQKNRTFAAKISVAVLSLIFLFVGLTFAGAGESPARVFAQANAYYRENKFDEAISGYNKIVEQGFENGNLYYNLGNSYFKKGELGEAILNYERAKVFLPSDSDLKSNYEYACSWAGLDNGRQKIIDRISAWVNLNSLAVILFLLQAAIFIVLIARIVLGRPFVFYQVIIACLLAAIILAGWAFKRKVDWLNRGAVVIVKEAEARFEPLEGSSAHFSLKEGSRVEVVESSPSWHKIRRQDGKKGWVKKEDVELINN